MASPFPSNPSNGDTVDLYGRTYEYSSYKNAWFPISSAISLSDIAGIGTIGSPSVGDVLLSDGDTLTPAPIPVPGISTAYATMANLPLAGNTIGDVASVIENNTLYVWNGATWYSIPVNGPI